MKRNLTIYDILLHSPKRYIFSFVAGILIVVLYNLLRDEWDILVNYQEAFSIAGFSIFFFGLLVLLSQFGAFDLWMYVFSKKKIVNGKKQIYSEFANEKMVVRSRAKLIFVPYLIIGLVFILVSLIWFFII